MHPQAKLVLILRSAHGRNVLRTRTRVRASRRMRTSLCIRPHASRRIAAQPICGACVPLCAAMLRSMRATVRSAFWPNEAKRQRGREGPTCGCGEMSAGSPSCFRPVLYREPCNLKVGPQPRRPAHRSSLLRRPRPTHHSSPRSRERGAEPQPFKILRSPLRSCRRSRRNGAAWLAWCPRKV
jgi:hypothetical protein